MLEWLKRPRGPLLALADALLINLSFLIAHWMRYDLEWPQIVAPEHQTPFAVFVPVALVLTGLSLFTFAIEGVYNQRRGRSWFDEAYAVFSGTATATVDDYMPAPWRRNNAINVLLQLMLSTGDVVGNTVSCMYDTLPAGFGLGMDPDDVDVAGFEQLRDTFFQDVEVDFVLTEPTSFK